jgi:hypothetical protein
MDGDILDMGADPISSIARAVVYLAVLDWRRIRAGRHVPGWDLDRLRCFLRSPWCCTLLAGTGIDGEQILERLETEI